MTRVAASACGEWTIRQRLRKTQFPLEPQAGKKLKKRDFDMQVEPAGPKTTRLKFGPSQDERLTSRRVI
jgi:hypothetical protein